MPVSSRTMFHLEDSPNAPIECRRQRSGLNVIGFGTPTCTLDIFLTDSQAHDLLSKLAFVIAPFINEGKI